MQYYYSSRCYFFLFVVEFIILYKKMCIYYVCANIENQMWKKMEN